MGALGDKGEGGREGEGRNKGRKERSGGTYKGGVGQSHDAGRHFSDENDEDDAEELRRQQWSDSLTDATAVFLFTF